MVGDLPIKTPTKKDMLSNTCLQEEIGASVSIVGSQGSNGSKNWEMPSVSLLNLRFGDPIAASVA